MKATIHCHLEGSPPDVPVGRLDSVWLELWQAKSQRKFSGWNLASNGKPRPAADLTTNVVGEALVGATVGRGQPLTDNECNQRVPSEDKALLHLLRFS